MKLFKKDSISQRIYRYVDEFQRGVQNGNYRGARDAVEKALKIDPRNKHLLEMKRTVLELIEMENARHRPAWSDVTSAITEEQNRRTYSPAGSLTNIETMLQSYGEALVAGDAETAASMWDKSSGDVTFISADNSTVRKGYAEIQDALKYESSNYNYLSYSLVEHSADNNDLVYAFYEVRVARLWDAYANIPGCKRVTLILRKRGDMWKIVHGHESTFSCFA